MRRLLARFDRSTVLEPEAVCAMFGHVELETSASQGDVTAVLRACVRCEHVFEFRRYEGQHPRPLSLA